MNQHSISDIIAALRYYEEWQEAIEDGNNDRADLPEVEAAIKKWYAALQAATNALPEPPRRDPWKPQGF